MSARSGLTVMVAGMVAGVPRQGGATWAVLQYVLGLRALGHDVWLVEPVSADPGREVVRYFGRVRKAFGLEERSALLLPGRRAHGLPYGRIVEAAARAALVIDIAGMLRDPELLERVPTRLYLDLDPGFTQLWSEVEGIDMRLEGHTHFATVGLEVGRPGCPVPTCGREWIHTLPPVVLEAWPRAGGIERDALTTIGNWRAYGSIEHDGVLYGQKAHALRELMVLPRSVPDRFELALSIHSEETEDLRALTENGWILLDPDVVAGSPEAYRRFIASSMAELGVTKSGYVHSRSGWFSDRSACYLASGRPVLAQDTGFSGHLPTGRGLLAFESCEQAREGVLSIRRDYDGHARAARQIAEEHLRHDRVLPRLLARTGVA